jgi:hypothetical protein
MFPNCRIYDLTVPARLATRDVRPFVTRREAGCDGRKGLFDETGPRVRSSRVVPIPRRCRAIAYDFDKSLTTESDGERSRIGCRTSASFSAGISEFLVICDSPTRRWDQVVQLAMSALRARHAEICAAMVAKEPGHQGERGVSRKAIAQGVPCDFGPA